MRLKSIALVACISGFALASCNNGDNKPTNADSNTVKKDSPVMPKQDTMSKKDTMRMDTGMKIKGKPVVPTNGPTSPGN